MIVCRHCRVKFRMTEEERKPLLDLFTATCPICDYDYIYEDKELVEPDTTSEW
jgi:hypothetical protein